MSTKLTTILIYTYNYYTNRRLAAEALAARHRYVYILILTYLYILILTYLYIIITTILIYTYNYYTYIYL